MRGFQKRIGLFVVLAFTTCPSPFAHSQNLIKSQIPPTPYIMPTVVRAPIAWTQSTGKGVTIGVAGTLDIADVGIAQLIAPDVKVEELKLTESMDPCEISGGLLSLLGQKNVHIFTILDPSQYNSGILIQTVDTLLANGYPVFINGDLTEDDDELRVLKELNRDALILGRLNVSAMIVFKKIHEFMPDIFAPVIHKREDMSTENKRAALVAAAVGAMVLEKYPVLKPNELKDHLLSTSYSCWQVTDPETRAWNYEALHIDRVTGEMSPSENEGKTPLFFKRIDAAKAVGVDTEHFWSLNAMNVPKVWETATGKGVKVAVIDMGFHVQNEEIKYNIVDEQYFGPEPIRGKPDPHGTSMSQVLVATAPDVDLVVISCRFEKAGDYEECAENMAAGIDYAIENNVKIISTSMGAMFAEYPVLENKIDEAVSKGVTVVWFHYGGSNPNVLKPSFFYRLINGDKSLGAFDRFNCAEGLYPVEWESGLSETAPNVAGVAALMLEKNPSLTPKEIVDTLLMTRISLGDDGNILDAYLAVNKVISDVADGSTSNLRTWELYQNYPNPFNPTTTIQYDLPKARHVELKIIDLLGRRVRTLVAEERTAGSHQASWNGLNDQGHPVASGVYLYTLKAEGYTETRKLLLIR